MLTKRIIPCLDVKDGRVVKGVSFVNLRDAGDPVEIAKAYDRDGADELCFLDITASYENRKTILGVVTRTAEQVFMPLTVGGGVGTLEDIRTLLTAGADKVSINTAAVEQPDFVKAAAERFGTQCIVVAIDAKRRATDAKRRTTDAKRRATSAKRRATGAKDHADGAKRSQAPAAGPAVTSWPMCEISKTPTLFRTARCSSRMLLYCTGMIQSPNGIIFAPSRTCSS